MLKQGISLNIPYFQSVFTMNILALPLYISTLYVAEILPTCCRLDDNKKNIY